MINIINEITSNKNGVEIGGPSKTGEIIYRNSQTIDNIVFSKNTIWSTHTDKDNFRTVIINEGVNISSVKNENYDFLFSSYCLEHIANPLKALKEWLRIVKNS